LLYLDIDYIVLTTSRCALLC